MYRPDGSPLRVPVLCGRAIFASFYPLNICTRVVVALNSRVHQLCLGICLDYSCLSSSLQNRLRASHNPFSSGDPQSLKSRRPSAQVCSSISQCSGYLAKSRPACCRIIILCENGSYAAVFALTLHEGYCISHNGFHNREAWPMTSDHGAQSYKL